MADNSLEALKLLADWSKWSIVAEGTAIGAISTFTKPDDIQALSNWSRLLLIICMLSFAISIVAASWLLKTLPAVATRLPPPAGKDVYHMGSWEGTRGLPLYWLSYFQTIGFWIGIGSFLAFIASRFSR